MSKSITPENTAKQNITQNKMGTAPMSRLLLTMGTPMIISMVIQAFYNIVDSYFISNMTSAQIPNIGDYAINALTLAFPVQVLIVALSVGTGVGANALLSTLLGAGKHEQANKVAGNAIFTSLCTYVLFLLFGLFGVRQFLQTQTSNELIIELGATYLSICTIFSFGTIIAMIYEKLLQSTGKTTLSTIAQLAGALTNIILDPILIFGYFGFPAMGIAGAAYATIAGQILTLILDAWFHYAWNHEINGSLRYLKPSVQTIINIYRVGAPAILMQVLMSVMSYGINIIFGFVCEAAVTAFGIYYKIQQFVFFAAFGMNNAVIPVVAFNYGKGDLKRITQGLKYGMIYTLTLMLAGAVFLQLFAAPICSMFALSPEALTLCVRAIRIVTPGYLFAGANIIFQGIFQALGCGIKSLILSLIRLIIVTLPLAWILTQLPRAQTFIWTAFPAAEAIGLITAIIFIRNVFNHKLAVLKNHA